MNNIETEKYNKACRSNFWQKIFRIETAYVMEHIKDCRDIVSIGCGPAFIERVLSESGINITGVDISEQTLELAPDSFKKVVASAENLPFSESSFDAAIYIASIQFIENYKKSIEEASFILKSGGKIIAMLLNPESAFFKSKLNNPNSYINMIKHRNIIEIKNAIADQFDVSTEYMIGVDGYSIFESQKPHESVLYIVMGIKK